MSEKVKSRYCELTARTPRGDVTYLLRRSSRRRTIEISISAEADLRVAAPSWTPEKEICRFIVSRFDWISARLKEASAARRYVQQRDYAHGQEFLFLGRRYPLMTERVPSVKRARIRFDEDGWLVTLPGSADRRTVRAMIQKRLIGWYRQQAQEVFGGRVFHFVRKMKLEPMTIAVKTQKRIWGSCHYRDKTIALNWLLVLAPRDVIDYVIIHELAHLRHPDHSSRFWAFVEKVMPDYRLCNHWLKEHRLDMQLPA
ncbi:MAG: M48 family metallopeptidase [Candidatus Omnitrophota bacterium]